MIFKLFLFILSVILFIFFLFYLLMDFGQARKKIDKESQQLKQEKRNTSNKNTPYKRR